MNKRITEAFANGKAFIPFFDLRRSVSGGNRAAGLCNGRSWSRPDRAWNPVLRSYRRGTCDPGSQCPALAGGVTTDKVLQW